MINISKYLDECLVKYSNYKPSKKNKKTFIEGNEENFKNFINKILEFKYSPLTQRRLQETEENEAAHRHRQQEVPSSHQKKEQALQRRRRLRRLP